MGECQPGHRIGVEDGETLQRLEKNFARVDAGAIVGTMRSHDELCLGTARDVRLKQLIWIVEIRNDDGEAGEVVLQFRRESSVPREEAGERPGFDGTDLVGQSARDG